PGRWPARRHRPTLAYPWSAATVASGPAPRPAGGTAPVRLIRARTQTRAVVGVLTPVESRGREDGRKDGTTGPAGVERRPYLAFISRILSISPAVNARAVCVCTFPSDPRWSITAVAVSSSGASNTSSPSKG